MKIPGVKLPALPAVPKPAKPPKLPAPVKVSAPKILPENPPHEPKQRPVWLGNKTGTPRLKGAGLQHRAAQVSATSYPTAKDPMSVPAAGDGKGHWSGH